MDWPCPQKTTVSTVAEEFTVEKNTLNRLCRTQETTDVVTLQ